MDRSALIGQVLDEMVEHAPFRLMRSMRRWPSGALSLVHLHVLMQLAEDGPLPMRALADTLDVSQASATGIVDRMEQRGLVERRRDDDDRRVIRVALTDAGRRLIVGIATERRGRLQVMLEDLTDDELAGFLRGSRALRRARERMHARLAAGVDPHAASAGTVADQGRGSQTADRRPARPSSATQPGQEASR